MKKTLGILAIALFSLMLFQHCQKSDFLVVTGVVRDSVTNQPVEGAYIISNNGIAVTSSNGTFTLEGVRPGKTNVSVHGFNGYKVFTKSAIINEGQVNKLDFSLSKIGDPELETGRLKTKLADKVSLVGAIKLKANMYATSYGHCCSTDPFPTLENYISKTDLGSTYGEKSFTSNLTGLQMGVTYYVRAYAVTQNGTIYGNTVVFRTSDLSIDAGMVSFLPFNDALLDESGNENFVWGWQNMFTTDRFGAPNKALKHGNNSFTYSYSYDGLFNSFNNFSISFWFYKTSWQNNTDIIFLGFPSFNNEIRIGEEPGPSKLFFNIRTMSGTNYKVAPTSAPLLNKWNNVVAVRENTTLKLYINGILQNTTVCDNQPVSPAYPGGYTYLFIGSDLMGAKPYFTGDVDDIRVYDRALTNNEINDLLTH